MSDQANEPQESYNAEPVKRKFGGPQPGAGRKPLAEEFKVSERAVRAIVRVYGSEDNYWNMLAEKSMESLPHQAMLHSYAYGKPIENKNVEIKMLPQVQAIKIDESNQTNESLPEDFIIEQAD